MDEKLKELINLYEDHIRVINIMLKDKDYDPMRNRRLRTKRSCYNIFITELKRLL